MAKAVKMADIAEKLGVSIVTVSKALNGKEGVGSTLRNEIIKTAKEMGYELPQSSSDADNSLVIGILNSYLYLQKNSSFYWNLYERLLKHLTHSDNLGILEIISKSAQSHCSIPKLVKGKRVDGLIVMGPFSDEYMHMLSSLDVPMVLLDSYNAKYDFDTVISDGYHGMYIMANYLIKQGHRRIAFVGTVGETSSITDRFFGYCKAMTEAGIKVTENMVIPDRNDIGKIELHLPPETVNKFTALACNCDYTAYEAVKLLNGQGFKVPDDISIVGFDNYILSEVMPVQITTYEVNQEKMAENSVSQICQRIRNPLKQHETFMTSGNIIIRDSVRKLNL